MGIDFDIFLMTLWNAACRALVSYFLQSDLTYSCKKNGNNKKIGCLSNDSTVLFLFYYACVTSSILSITGINLSKYICSAFSFSHHFTIVDNF